jgi:hypothetical protein
MILFMVSIRAQFDGRVFVPDEPVNLRAGEAVRVQPLGEAESMPVGGWADAGERLRRQQTAAGRYSAPAPSDESLRRENIYDDRL